MGGYITGDSLNIEDFIPVMLASAILTTIGILYLIFVIPETLNLKASRSESTNTVNNDIITNDHSKYFFSWATQENYSKLKSVLKNESKKFSTLPPLVVAIQVTLAMVLFEMSFDVQYQNYK